MYACGSVHEDVMLHKHAMFVKDCVSFRKYTLPKSHLSCRVQHSLATRVYTMKVNNAGLICSVYTRELKKRVIFFTAPLAMYAQQVRMAQH